MIEHDGLQLKLVVIEELGEEEYLMDEDENIYNLGYEFVGNIQEILQKA